MSNNIKASIYIFKFHMKDLFKGDKLEDCWQWTFKRNCSISPHQLTIIFSLLGLISLSIGISFYLMGAVLILPFSFIEILALLTAFYYNAVHANDYEKLLLGTNFLTVELKNGNRITNTQFVRAFSQVKLIPEHKNMILMSQGSRRVYFGSHVHASKRHLLEREIKAKL